jgi:murein L,D-transpeptidase YafK
MPLTLLVGTAALTLVGIADSSRANKPAPAPPKSFSADSIVVEKSAHRLSLYHDGALVRSYLVALGQQPVGDKVRRGDNRTPEGLFHIEARNPNSRYHRALRISYPDATHRERALALGVSPGGDIMIHGLPARQAWVGAAHRDFDWTEGCIAVTNAEIEEIWSAVPVGTPIHIKP